MATIFVPVGTQLTDVNRIPTNEVLDGDNLTFQRSNLDTWEMQNDIASVVERHGVLFVEDSGRYTPVQAWFNCDQLDAGWRLDRVHRSSRWKA